MKSGDFLPHRSDTEAGRARCDVVNECMKPSDCGTSHQPPYRSAERSPGQKSEGRRAFTFRHSADTKKSRQLGSVSKTRCSCSNLWVDAEVFSGGEGQSQEVVGLSCLLAIKLHQLL